MLGIVIFAAIIWIVVQASAERNQRKWKGRFEAPLAMRVRGDAVAIARQIRARHVYRRETRSWHGDDWTKHDWTEEIS